MTKVTIIIHEGHGGPGRGRHIGRPHGRRPAGGGCAEGQFIERDRRGHRPADAQLGSEREFGGRGHHGRPDGERAFDGPRHSRHDHGRHRPDHELSEAELAQRQLARQVRREVRRVLREAEAAGLNPERAAHVVRRETRRAYL